MRNRIGVVFISLLLVSAVAFAKTPAKDIRISKEKAQSIALEKAPGGKVESSEVEYEKSQWVYSFDIRNTKGTITEVLVNAKDGHVVSVQEENKAKEAAEKKQEAAEKKAAARKKH